MVPMSPLWNHPPRSACVVSSARFQYPFITPGPRITISPQVPGSTCRSESSAIRSSKFSIAVPTVPGLRAKSWAAELRRPAGADLIRQGRRRRELVADVSQVARRDTGREQVDVDHRHGEELRDPIPLDRLEHLAWHESAVKHDRGAGSEASVCDEVLPEDVKQGQEQDQPVVGLVAAMVDDRPCVRYHVGVRERRALWLS